MYRSVKVKISKERMWGVLRQDVRVHKDEDEDEGSSESSSQCLDKERTHAKILHTGAAVLLGGFLSVWMRKVKEWLEAFPLLFPFDRH